MKLLAVILLAAAPAWAGPHKTADKAWWILNAASWGATVADVENTQYALHHCAHCVEGNPLYGPHPSRARMYAIAGPLAGLTTWLSYRWKKQDDEDIAAGRKPAPERWYLLPIVNISTHGVGIGITIGLTGK